MNVKQEEMLIPHIRWQRFRHIKGGYGWPGKPVNEPFVTLYPNLLAELGYGPPWLYLLAEFADVSHEIMTAVLEDGEELTKSEILRVSRRLGVDCGYLTAKKLSIIDPSTNKGKARKRVLEDMVERAKGLKYWEWPVERVLCDMSEGRPVLYTAYRFAMRELQDAISKDELKRHKPRSVRIGSIA